MNQEEYVVKYHGGPLGGVDDLIVGEPSFVLQHSLFADHDSGALFDVVEYEMAYLDHGVVGYEYVRTV